ncbi:MAG: amidohydrolase family protein [Candidatus Obscuribacterales bacterium]|nr:amidohydrolase family protein [Candidatus Obscuribacterales bacterium]
MSFDIEKFVIIDHHAHSLLKSFRELDEIGFRQSFTESRSMSIIKDHMPKTVHYIDMVDHLKRIFDVKTEQDFLSFRMQQSPSGFIQMLWDDVSLGGMIIDDGFNSAESMGLDELAHLSGRPIYHCRRIETIIEACIADADNFAELSKNFKKKLLAKNKHQTVSLKTICGYRGGLELLHPSEADAKLDFDKWKQESAKQGKLRIQKSPLYHYLLLQAFEIAAEAKIPIQVHSGIGDDDADLVKCNPALMQNLFRSRAFAKCTFVMLHCYPYIREAAIMCSLYGNVYMDLSLSMSLASPNSASMVSEALAVAPASKLLAASDGHSCPESHWYGALCWKRGLNYCLLEMINEGLITQREAEEIAALILHNNAISLYKLEGLA